MPVAKHYASNAERQAAYRARHPEKRNPTDAELANLARCLHWVLSEAVQAGICPLPSALVGTRADQTLRHVIRYLDPHPDPVVYSGVQWQLAVAPLCPDEDFPPAELG
jgi:hypothetical protein